MPAVLVAEGSGISARQLIAALSHTPEALFGVGAAALLLLFIGIHNAWDAIAYHVLVNKDDTKN